MNLYLKLFLPSSFYSNCRFNAQGQLLSIYSPANVTFAPKCTLANK